MRGGVIAAVVPAAQDGASTTMRNGESRADLPEVDLDGGMCWPTFVDVHTHIDKGHTCERSRNRSGSLAGKAQTCMLVVYQCICTPPASATLARCHPDCLLVVYRCTRTFRPLAHHPTHTSMVSLPNIPPITPRSMAS